MTDQELKQAFVDRLKGLHIPEALYDVDARIPEYIEHVRTHAEGEQDVHNIDEVAGCCRFLRMCRAYQFDASHVRRFVRMYENFKFSGLKGRQCYKMTPIQVYLTAGIFGFMKGEGRRMVREAIVFIPRKFAKTTYLAALSLDEFLFGDSNGEVHIVANAHEQAKIAYREAKALAMQLDPDGNQIRFTADQFNWREGQAKSSMVAAHTAGGKTKDGAFASLVLADEYGSAQYVKDHSDMADAINVYESSMGPRVNPLTVITTTAGKVINGPFEQKLMAAQQALYKELELGEDEQAATDWQFVLALHPDKWEYSDEYYATDRLHNKCNPHIGITVQSDYYQQQWQKAQGDPEVYKEVVTKLFNVFVSGSSKPWVQAEDIRRLQTDYRIDQLDPHDWACFVGLDFSHGDDLHTMAYNCYCYNKNNPHYGQYFWDCDCWIAEEQLASNTNATLYRQFIQNGDLHVSKDKVIPGSLLVDRLNEVSKHVNIVRIGYDAYDARDNINDITAWAISRMKEKGKSQKFINEEIKRLIQPVSQTWSSYSQAVQIMWKQIFEKPQRVFVSRNTLLPWTFGNGVCDVDRMDNCKIVKSGPNRKVDPVQALQSGIILQQQMIK